MEKEQSLVVKHCAEMDFARALAATKAEDEACRQQAADFAHKCKHLELDLKKALEAAECARQQLITTTHNKDAAISELEQALRKLEEKLYNVEENHKTMEKDWEREQKKLQHVIEDKERHELQMLRAKEEAEIQLREECEQCIKQIKHEKEESEWQWKEESECHVKEALMEARIEEERQRDLRRTLEGEAADLRAMLTAVEQASTDAEARHTESENQLTKCQTIPDLERICNNLKGIANRNMQNECEKQLEQLKNTVHELRSQQEKDHIDEGNRLEDAKKLKERNKLLATMTVEHNQLLVRLREMETHLSIAQTTKLVYASNPSTRITPRYSKTFVGGNLSAAWLKSEMTELERRQSQYRPFHKHEAKIPADTEHLKVPVIDIETTAPTWK
ncbi:hypothetical protein CY35_13G008500 [Sphagnum magellanicum]|nr:hypothetical protein CY35_13G008500 [Sphagnum magellanicum]